jgi:hypothetical protein
MDLQKEIGLVKAEKAYKMVVLIAFFTLLVSLVGWVLMYLKTQKDIVDISSKVVVINAGSVTEGDLVEMNPTEMFALRSENVLRIGVEYMYSFTPSNYDERISMAKSYWGQSGKEIIQSYINENVKSKIIQNNLRVDVSIKELSVELENGVFKGRVLFEQSFLNADNVQKRSIEIVCSFVETQVSSKNSHGIIIENAIIKVL